ncbi:BREX system ATP-binding domain-containing protein [Chitinophaga sp. sic0106]|uniref:BREX system ATP-binding domain-containing protein n=1 Tax=Chitinophaga sp. sic0106 TaxID=2854785 RepID=UPI001C445BE8|nr:BREX system ATP-binding domain-containing protein [Chitinophaga sp. sic0106]MBV7533820.1 DUF2791 family P-loop domain-containing protein [Chitinophaga sp. sic0106]
MKLLNVLETYEPAMLDQLAADKIDEAISLRLPQTVIIQEIISALSSQSYISDKIQYGKPPMYAILNLIIQAPDFMIEVDGFRAKVLMNLKELTQRATQSTSGKEKDAKLYIKILKRAWENDGLIDKSEAYILELVKNELGIWEREHFTLMHDSSIIDLWNIDQEYYNVRNFLLATGILLTYDNKYLIADEVAVQIRKTFGIELMDDSFRRLLTAFSREELSQLLNFYQLNISGTKDIMVNRLIEALIPPNDLLSQINLENLRDYCRSNGIAISGSKNAVIANIIQYFDEECDLAAKITHDLSPLAPPEPEMREMDSDVYAKVLGNLTGQQLYDILYQNQLMTSGTKDEKIKRILECYKSERSILNYLRKDDLSLLCRKFGLNISGAKQELIDRILDYSPTYLSIELRATVAPELDAALASSELQEKILEPSVLPSNWTEVDGSFPNFGNDEKIIISILKEAKSITEQDLTRIVTKHQLGWFLHKAHMAEIMAKLKKENRPYIQIKSVQSTNIYQWTSNDIADGIILEKRSARDIIDALRHGVVPRTNLNLLMVGQQTARNHLADILLEVNSNKSHFKFIRGQYGSGKTFLCSWLKEFALEHEFAVSFINISHEQPLSDLPIFFSGLITGLRTPEKTDSSALVDILESWLLNIHNKTARIEGIDYSQPQEQETLSKIVEKAIEVELANFNDIEPGFSQALRAFYEGKMKGDMELTSNAVAWIMGSKSLSAQALRDIGVKGYLESNNVFARMRAILEIISGARYKGLLLLVDELELVRKFPHARQREQALETLRLLIDEAGRNALPGCLLIFTGTDEFFEDERYGLKSYEALSERVLTPFTHENYVSMRQPIISLESLNRERLTKVVLKIRDLYGIAYGWNAKHYVDDDAVVEVINEWTVFGEESVDRKPRPILREFIQMLDLCEENQGVYLRQFLKKSASSLTNEGSVILN